MLTLKSLTFKNIGRFIEPQTIDLTQLGSLVQLEGQNNNTGGSSGAGKSTIAKAICWLLGLEGPSTTILQSRLTKDQICVSAIFDYDGQNLVIERNKKLSVTINGNTITGSSKLTEEELDRIIGMPRELFSKIIHKAQGSGGFFLDLGPSQTHKFLTSCLNLDTEQSKISVLELRLEQLEKSKSVIIGTIQTNKSALEATEKSISILGRPPVQEVDSGLIESLEIDYLNAQGNHIFVRNRQKSDLDILEKSRPEISILAFDRSKIQILENEIQNLVVKIGDLEKKELFRQSEIKQKIAELKDECSKLESNELARQSEVKSKLYTNRIEETKALHLVNEGKRAKSEASSLAVELKEIRSSICPTCRQSWNTESSKLKEYELLDKLQGYKKAVMLGMEAEKTVWALLEEKSALDLEKLPKSIPGINIILEEINVLSEKSQPLEIPEIELLKKNKHAKEHELRLIRQEEHLYIANQNARSKAMLESFDKKRSELILIQESEIKVLRDLESKCLDLLQKAKSNLKSFEENKNRFEQQFNKLMSEVIKFNDIINLKTKELIEIEEEIETCSQSKKAIKSYLSCSFEDALESIGDTATRLIRSIPNMSNATIQFEGLKETKDGKIKEEVTCVVSMDGEIAIPVKSLSGGERSSTDLAIDLAVIKFIEERTGKGCSLFILDEPFTGLDSQNILEALEMLRESSFDKQLLIVDHNPVAAQSIENRLTVIRDGLTSRVVQQ